MLYGKIRTLDIVLLILGPFLIATVGILVPAAIDEGTSPGEKAAAPVIAELVGYSLRNGTGERPLLLGRDQEADLRLHSARVPDRAGMLFPPGDGFGWRLVPAEPGVSLRLRKAPENRGQQPDQPWRRASFRPWRDRRPSDVVVGCHEELLRLEATELTLIRSWGDPDQLPEPLSEPELAWSLRSQDRLISAAESRTDILICGAGERIHQAAEGTAGGRSAEEICAGDLSAWRSVGLCRLWSRSGACYGFSSQRFAVRVTESSGAVSVLDRSVKPFGRLWVEAAAGPDGVSLGLSGGDGLERGCTPQTPCLPPDSVPICITGAAGELEEVAVVDPLEFETGDVLAIGRTHFLVRTIEQNGETGVQLLHVRDPGAPSFFRSSAGAEVYHPNRRAIWRLPRCADEAARVRDLTLVVRTSDFENGDHASEPPVGVATRDRGRRRQIERAAANYGVPLEIPSALSGLESAREAVSLCVDEDAEAGWQVRLKTDSRAGVRLARESLDDLEDAENRLFKETEGRRFPVGSRSGPKESVLEFGGHLIRIAPAAGRRVTVGQRLLLMLFLFAVVTVLSLLLTLARILRRQILEQEAQRAEEIAWPADSGPATLQQIVSIAVVFLLFVGAEYHLFLALHPQLAGKPDYAQAFLQGLVLVTVLLLAGAALTAGRPPLLTRCGLGLAGAALGFALAGTWWWLDGLAVPEGLWLSGERNASIALFSGGSFGRFLLLGFLAALILAAICILSDRLRIVGLLSDGLLDRSRRLALGFPLILGALLVLGGLLFGELAGSALAAEIFILMGFAWILAFYWNFVKRGRLIGDPVVLRRAARIANLTGFVVLLSLALFFFWGSDVPDALSMVLVLAGLGCLTAAIVLIRKHQHGNLRRVLAIWLLILVVGSVFAIGRLNDMGSIAAWAPALLAGFVLWVVRPDELENRAEEESQARVHLLLACGAGLLLLGILDVVSLTVETLPFDALNRPRQRFELTHDISYITPGEWITQVRWLASRHDSALEWVPNMNSDVAIFGLGANFGLPLTLLSSLAVLAIAACAGLAADQALREARSFSTRGFETEEELRRLRFFAVLFRGLGLLLFMVGILLTAQWLVHLATGVVLHLPITGLVFPWISHGNTTHLLYTVVLILPLAGLTFLGSLSLSTLGGMHGSR